MKYVLIIGDGMADNPVPQLDGRTPLEASNKPHIDALAAKISELSGFNVTIEEAKETVKNS